MQNADNAETTFKKGFNCSQSVLTTFAAKLNISPEVACKIATGFGGGMGRKQEVCGAVSGALMVIGLMYGRGLTDGRDKQEMTYIKVREFFNEFEKKHGTVNCKELLSGCNLLTDEGQNFFKENNLIEKCYEYVRTSCDILEQMLEAN